MEWKIVNTDQVITDGIDNSTVFNMSVTYTLNLIVTPAMNETIYSCTTKFVEAMKPPDINATNAPSYNHTWVYPLSRLFKQPEIFGQDLNCIIHMYLNESVTSLHVFSHLGI